MDYQNYAGAWLAEANQAGLTYVKGTGASETLYGGGGADEFEGGGGRDTFIGGGGDDYYWLRDPKDLIAEYGGGGVDTARIWSSYTLPANVENLFSFGAGSYAAGNAQDNIIHGLENNQFLYGGLGRDVLIGGDGADIFVIRAGEGDKVIQDFQSWSDKVRLVGGDLSTFQAVQAAMTQQGSDVVLNDDGTMIAFRNAAVSQFQARDFQLPIDYQALGAPTFNDDFNSLQTGSVWKTNFGYAGEGQGSFTLPRNGELQVYVAPEFKGTTGAPLGLNPYNIDNGTLTLTAQPASGELAAKMWGQQYTSGMLMSNYTQTYGYFEIRAELPHGQGLWPAFWMIGPDNNEIDILEGLGSDTKTPNNAIHTNAVPAIGMANFIPDDSGFHTYGALWSPTDIVFYADGTEIWRTATPPDMNKPMQMIVNLAVGGPWAGAPDATTPWPAQMKIDYIRAYSLPGATPPVTPPTSGGDQVLNSPWPGATLSGGAGNDTLNASQGADVLTGAGGADTFAFKAMPWSAGRITDFQAGVDRLDISRLYTNGYSGGDPVKDGYVTFASDGAGGTKVMLDVDGPGGPSSLSFHVVTLDNTPPAALTSTNVFDAAAAPPVTPPQGAGVVLTSAYPGAVLTGGAGADTLNASQGADTLTGGAGADHFVFDKAPWSAGHVTDFQHGVDVLDLRGLFQAAGYRGSDPIADGALRLEANGAGGTNLLFDSDGWGSANPWPIRVTTLDGVSPAALSASDWLI